MVNNLKDILENEIGSFLRIRIKDNYKIVQNNSIEDNKISFSLEQILSNHNLNSKKGEFLINLVIIESYNEIHIDSLLCTGIFKEQGMAKQLIQLIYKKGKEYDYETLLVNLSPSFFNSMRRRKAKVINKQCVKITDETDLTTIRTTPRPFTNDLLNYNNVKKEFLPYLPPYLNAISFLKWKQKNIEYVLSDFDFPKIRNIIKEKKRLLFPVFNIEYIAETYFNPEDPFSLDKELCEQFYFYIRKSNPLVELLRETGTEYTLVEGHQQEICTLNSGKFCKYSSIFFKDIDDLKMQMSNNLNCDILNILVWAKSKNKIIFKALEKKPLH